jgi:16S rRNA processing protein RimM
MTDPYVEVGRVVGTHGVSGKVKVESWSGDLSGLLSVRRIRIRDPRAGSGGRHRECEVKTAQRSGGCAVLLLAGIDSVEEASALRGSVVSVPRSELPPPGEGEYYWVDLVGCEVVTAAGGRLGVVAGVTEGPAHDWLVILRGEEEAMLPLVAAFIRKVDLARRRITADPPQGW